MNHSAYRKTHVCTLLIASFAAASAYADTLLVDEFNGPALDPVWQASLPAAGHRFGREPALYQGASQFTFEMLNGRSVLRLHNTLNDLERRGFSSSTIFSADTPIFYQARFNTLVQQNFATGIDELLEIWVLDASDPTRYDILALSGPGRGTFSDRVFSSGSSFSGAGRDAQFGFADNTWYRMVISGSATHELRASIYNDTGTQELIGVDLGHTLSAYPSGFRIGFSQSVGFPNLPAPTDVALDSLRLTTSPPDDEDGDGVADKVDQCPNSDLSATVAIGECDSGVTNPTFPSGCTLSDLAAACEHGKHDHGHSGACIAHLTNDLASDRIITRRQKNAILRCAVESASK